MIVLQDEVNEKVVSLCIRGGKIFCTDFKSIAAEAAQGDGTVPKCAKNFLEKGQKKMKPYINGKQSMEKLKAHNQELSNIEVTEWEYPVF